MDTFITFATIITTTIIALFSALALQAVLLRAAFALMQPATAGRRVSPPAIERGTQLAAHAFARGR